MQIRYFLALSATFASLLSAAEKESLPQGTAEQPAVVVKAGIVPFIKLRARPAVTEEREAEIRRWIEMLTEVDGPSYGYSSTISGSIFAPQPESAQAGALLLTQHALKASKTVLHLVETGADAIPFLLEKLDDATPTRYSIEHKGRFGGMWTGVEMSTNPADVIEKKPPARRNFGSEPNLDTYTIKTGDLCFVILGQITGRGYQAIRYQPTACIIINSPVESKELREAVRANWNSPDPRAKLFERLLFDYSTEGVFNGNSLDGWSLGSHLKVEATRRLAYYFADETSDLLVKTIGDLDLKRVQERDGNELWMKREIKNGSRTKEFLKALTGAKSPAVQKALLEASQRTDDPDIFRTLRPSKSFRVNR